MRFIETIKNIWKIEDLRNRLLTTALFVLIYRFGSYVILPGVNPDALTALKGQTEGGLMALLDMFSGGAFSNASIFALGIMPYISASIVVQLLSIAVPYFQKMQKEGESGRQKMNQITRYLTVAILLFQGPSYLFNLRAQIAAAVQSTPALANVEVPVIGFNGFTITATILLAAGSMFVLWLGERITDRGVGNGISIVLVINIVSRLPQDVTTLFNQFIKGQTIARGILIGVIIAAIIIGIVVLVVILQCAERRIPVQYSSKIRGNKQVSGQQTHIPLKVNTSGVIPVIFAQSLMYTPVIIAGVLGKGNGTGIGSKILRGLSQSNWCDPENPVYSIGLVVYIALVIAFAYFYTQITFNPLEVANNMKRAGGFVPGIRPGKPTSDYLNQILNYIVFIGAVGLTIVAVIPIFFNGVFNANVSFGGTSIIIVVGVVVETLKQVESQMRVRYYKGFLNE